MIGWGDAGEECLDGGGEAGKEYLIGIRDDWMGVCRGGLIGRGDAGDE